MRHTDTPATTTPDEHIRSLCFHQCDALDAIAVRAIERRAVRNLAADAPKRSVRRSKGRVEIHSDVRSHPGVADKVA